MGASGAHAVAHKHAQKLHKSKTNFGKNNIPSHRTPMDLRAVHGLSNYVVYGVVFTLSVVVYSNSLHGDLVHDDIYVITNNRDALGDTPLPHVFANDFWGRSMADNTSHKSYRPITVLTFRLNHWWSGLDPFGYHVVNVLLHATVSALLTYMVYTAIFPGNLRSAGLTGCLFAVHPIHTEAVSGVVGRADLLAAALFLLAFITYRKGAGVETVSGIATLTLSYTLAALSMLAKETGITVLGLCLAYDLLQMIRTRAHRCRHEACRGWRSLLSCPYHKRVIHRMCLTSFVFCRFNMARKKRKTSSAEGVSKKNEAEPWWAMVPPVYWAKVAVPGLSKKVYWPVLGVGEAENGLKVYIPSDDWQFLTYCYLVPLNVWLLLCPWTLSYDWQMGSVPLVESCLDLRNLVTLACIAGGMVLLWRGLQNIQSRYNPLLWGLLFMALPFIPASNLFIRVGFVLAERILYIPSIGFIIVLVHSFHVIGGPNGRSLVWWLFMVSLGGSWLGRTMCRNQVWHNRETLFRSGLQSLPHNAKMHYNYANYLKDTGNVLMALQHYQKAIGLWPEHVSSHNNLGTLLRDHAQAENHYREAIRLNHQHTSAHFNLGNLLLHQGRWDEAVDSLSRSVATDPDNADAHSLLANALVQAGRTVEAEHHYKQAILYKPNNGNFHNNLGAFLENKGAYVEAEQAYRNALQATATYPGALLNLARVLKVAQRNTEAGIYYERALSISRDADTLDAAGVFQFSIGRVEEAIEFFSEAINADSNHQDATFHYAQSLSSIGEYRKSERILNELLLQNPEHLEALHQLANVYGLTGRHNQAVMRLEQALSLANDVGLRAQLYTEQGHHYKDMQDYDKALQSYIQAIDTNRDISTAHINSGVIYHLKGDFHAARRHYEEALRIQPSHELVADNLEKLTYAENMLLKQNMGEQPALSTSSVTEQQSGSTESHRDKLPSTEWPPNDTITPSIETDSLAAGPLGEYTAQKDLDHIERHRCDVHTFYPLIAPLSESTCNGSVIPEEQYHVGSYTSPGHNLTEYKQHILPPVLCIQPDGVG